MNIRDLILFVLTGGVTTSLYFALRDNSISGTYIGDGTIFRPINLEFTPNLVYVTNDFDEAFIIDRHTGANFLSRNTHGYPTLRIDENLFIVGADPHPVFAPDRIVLNEEGENYYYTAIR